MIFNVKILDKKNIIFYQNKENGKTYELNIEDNNIDSFNDLLDCVIENVAKVEFKEEYDVEKDSIDVSIANKIIKLLRKEISEIQTNKRNLFAKNNLDK